MKLFYAGFLPTWPHAQENQRRYYEVRVQVPELVQVGWARDGFEPDEDGGVGDDECMTISPSFFY
jgi:hypothetical protein